MVNKSENSLAGRVSRIVAADSFLLFQSAFFSGNDFYLFGSNKNK